QVVQLSREYGRGQAGEERVMPAVDAVVEKQDRAFSLEAGPMEAKSARPEEAPGHGPLEGERDRHATRLAKGSGRGSRRGARNRDTTSTVAARIQNQAM